MDEFNTALFQVVSEMCAGKIPEPLQRNGWTLFDDLKLEAASHYSHNFQRYRYIPFRLAVTHDKCRSEISRAQSAGLDEYGDPVRQGKKPRKKKGRSTYHFLNYWLLEALGKMEFAADMAYSMERLHPQELGFDVIIHGESDWEIRKWYRGERHILDDLIGGTF